MDRACEVQSLWVIQWSSAAHLRCFAHKTMPTLSLLPYSLLGIEGLSSYDATPDVSTLSEISMPPDNSILECQVMIPVDTPPEGISLGIDIGGGSDCPPVRDLAGKVSDRSLLPCQ